MKHAVIIGTRPQIIKMAPFITELHRRQLDYFVIDTGQHTIPAMQAQMYHDLDIPRPKYSLGEFETGKTLCMIENILGEEEPDVVHVHGDTDSCVLGALAASAIGTPVAHHEAGLRAGTLWMREERNRILTDHIAEYLFAPTARAHVNLNEEHVRGAIFVTGNLIADVLRINSSETPPQPGKPPYVLLTLHRQETVDNPVLLRNTLAGVSVAAEWLQVPVVYPVHPRAADRMHELGVIIPENIDPITPCGFREFLGLERNAYMIMTDSGGVQEEACILGVPCVTLRVSTERPETVVLGANLVSGHDPTEILEAAKAMSRSDRGWSHPYGDGHTAEKVIAIMEDL